METLDYKADLAAHVSKKNTWKENIMSFIKWD